LFVALSNCEIKTRETVAQPKNPSDVKNDFYHDEYYGLNYQYHEEERSGMSYGIWSKTANSSQTGYAVAVVNLTKDELEVELLKLQISKVHKELHNE